MRIDVGFAGKKQRRFLNIDPHGQHAMEEGGRVQIAEVLPKAGLVYSEKGQLTETLSKPKIMPLKSITLERIEQMEREAREAVEAQEAREKEEKTKEKEKEAMERGETRRLE
jgi:BBSome-interacting protein 1